MKQKINVAIIGPGNIGIDLMCKIMKNPSDMVLKLIVGRNKGSYGLRKAKEMGVETSTEGIQAIIKRDDIDIVFDATTAAAHSLHAPLLSRAGIIAIDLTPAAVGPFVMPVVNLDEYIDSLNVNLITCGGQATIPIVYAIASVLIVNYAEVVATISSKSAGPGTRQNIDEFTQTTARGIVDVGKAKSGKAIILLNPAEPPMIMNNTIYAITEDPINMENKNLIKQSVNDMVQKVQSFVPGYRLKIPPMFDDNKVTVMIEVAGAGDYLPIYSGNLDIETSAAFAIGKKMAQFLLKKRGVCNVGD